MHLDSRTQLAHAPLAPPDWAMDLVRDGSQYIGVVKRRNITMCRMSIASDSLSEADARTALAEKARYWIAEYLARAPERQVRKQKAHGEV